MEIRAYSLRNPPILYRYVFQEIVGPFFLSLFIFTGVLFLARILKLVDMVVNRSVSLLDILLLFSYVLPGFFEIAIPMALLLGVILAFGRLSSDSEIIVLRASGFSIKQLAVPVLGFAFLCFLACLMLGFFIRPWSSYQLGQGMFEIAKTKASSGLTQGVFNDFGPLTIYSERIESTSDRLINVLIADRRDPEVNRLFVAKYGQLVSDPQSRTLSLRLYEGSIQEGSGLNFNITYFQINSLSLPQSELVDDGQTRTGKRSNEMLISELQQAIRNLRQAPQPLSEEDHLQLARYRVEFQRRLAIPFSTFCIALAAIALGIQPVRSGQGWGATANIILGIMLILVYYLLLALGTALGSHAVVPPWLVLWLPNLSFLLIGWYWLRQIGSEKWMAVSQSLAEVFRWASRKVSLPDPATASTTSNGGTP